MMNIVTLDSHLSHGLRCEQCSNGRDNWTIETGKDNSIADIQSTINQDNVYGSSMALNDLDLED